MVEVFADVFTRYQNYDALCITTNGAVKASGEAVMGRGIAYKIKEFIPEISLTLGMSLIRDGNRVMPLAVLDETQVWSFPVKPKSVVVKKDRSNVVKHMHKLAVPGRVMPGWAAVADIEIIERSCVELDLLTDELNLSKILLPRPGCGAGELSYDDVKPVLEKHLDDRFHIITYR